MEPYDSEYDWYEHPAESCLDSVIKWVVICVGLALFAWISIRGLA